MKRSLLLLFMAVLSAAGMAQVRFGTSPDAARRKALASGKPLLVEVGAAWCQPCRDMEREVFSRGDVGEFVDGNFVPLRIDADTGTGRAVMRKYGVISLPSFLVLDTDGNLLGRTAGARPASDFIADMRRMLRHIADGRR